MLICGPSGSGKTAITQEMARWMDKPYMYVPITTYTQSGYVGDNVIDIIDSITSKSIKSLSSSLKAELVSLQRICKGDLSKPLPGFCLELFLRPYKDCLPVIESIIVNPRFKHLKDLSITGTNAFNRFKDNLLTEERAELASKHNVSVDYVMLCIIISRAMEYSRALAENLPGVLSTIIESSIVLIDEIDKIAQNKGDNDNVGRVGVQRDLLMLLDGNSLTSECTAKELAFVDEFTKEVDELTRTVDVDAKGKTKSRKPVKGNVTAYATSSDFFGTLLLGGTNHNKKSDVKVPVNTAKIWFIGAGAFILDDLSGLIDELRGRFSVITRTKALTKEEIKELVEYKTISDINELTEFAGIKISFEEGAVDTFVDAVFELNKHEPLGARRLPGFINQILANEAMDLEQDKEFIITSDMVVRAAEDVRNANRYKMQLGFK
jgi:ATP-dependent protease HslVU (ClpYQ) ATPase subunit